jgi:hypothetical protein
MDRRSFLAVGAIGLAGCSTDMLGGGPEYGEDIEDADLLLSIDAFPDDWKRDDSFNDSFDAVFLNADESILVLQEARVHESIEEAKDSFGLISDKFRDPQDIDIGDEAFWDTRNEELAYCAVRDSNAVGGIGGSRKSASGVVPAQNRAQTYARKMVEAWGEL